MIARALSLVLIAGCASAPRPPPPETPPEPPRPIAPVTHAPAANAPPRSPVGTVMVGVLAGEVVQAPNPDADSGEWLGSAPNFRADVGAFEIDEEPASVADYGRCVAAGACSAPGTAADHPGCAAPPRPDAPVGCIDQAQAHAFCAWANKRLPTELEVLRAEMTLRERRPKRALEAKEWTSTLARWKEWPNDAAFVVAHAAPRWSRRGQRPSARQPALGVRCVRSKETPTEPAPRAAESRPRLPDDAIAKYTAIWLGEVQRQSGLKPAELAKHVTITSAAWTGRDRVDLELALRVQAGWFVIEGLKSTLPVSLDCASRSSAAPCDSWLDSADYDTLKSEGATIGRRFSLRGLAIKNENAAYAAVKRRFGPPGTDFARGLDEQGRPWLCALVKDPDVPEGGTIGGVNLITAQTDRCQGVEIPGELPWSQ